MKRTAIAVCLILCGSFQLATASDNDLEKQLADQYHNKVLYLRHSFTSDFQEYDAEGNISEPGEEGLWSFYGRMVITKIAIGKDGLRVEGKRAVYRTDGQLCGKDCMPFGKGKDLKITIRLNGPLASISDANTALGRVFAVTPEDTVSSVPPYWRDYVGKLISLDRKPLAAKPVEGDRVFKIGDPQITAPKPSYAPEPEFTEEARKQSFQGIVGLDIIVNKAGRVGRVSITSPLGMGLDEQAANMVRTWRFLPATHNGEPVAVAVYVEVDFRLYRRP